MSIKYKMMEKKDNLNTDEKKVSGYYPVVVRNRTIGLEELAQRASEHCSMNAFEIEMALKVVLKTIQDELLDSNNVCLEGFGTFSLKAESRHVDKPAELRAESIFVKKVSFKNSPILVKRIKKADFVKWKK